MAKVIFKNLASEMEIEVMCRGLVVLFPEPSNPILCLNTVAGSQGVFQGGGGGVAV